MTSDGYRVPWLANFFHSFPHVDLRFHVVNSSCNPDNPNYREVRMSFMILEWFFFSNGVF